MSRSGLYAMIPARLRLDDGALVAIRDRSLDHEPPNRLSNVVDTNKLILMSDGP
jgi:hypothetical protein